MDCNILSSTNNEFHIADLDPAERGLLVSYLFTLIFKYKQNAQNQKDYYFSVKNYLSVAEANSNLDLSLVENIDSRAKSKVLFRTICEFLFLKDNSSAFLEEFDEELSSFGLSRKAMQEVIASITELYEIMGTRSIVEHYGVAPATAHATPAASVASASAPAVPETNVAVTEEAEEEEEDERDSEEWLERITIDYDESRTEEDKIIYIGNAINIYGSLTFKKCKVFMYYVNLPAKITMFEEGSLTFEDCEIVCCSENKNYTITYDEECLDEYDDEEDDIPYPVILFDKCKITGGNLFVEAGGPIKIRKCQILNPGYRFLNATSYNDKETKLESTTIQFDKPISAFNFKNRNAIFLLSPGRAAIIKNCNIIFPRIDEKPLKWTPLSLQNIYVNNTKTDTATVLFEESVNGIIFNKCKFQNVSDLLLRTTTKETVFNECRFIGCRSNIVYQSSILTMKTHKDFARSCTFTEK